MDKIYILQNDEGFYKIGFTSKPINERIKQLQVGYHGNLFPVLQFPTEHGRNLESALHRKFKFQKINGEWFDLSENDLVNAKKYCNVLENSITILKKNQNPFI